MASWARPSGLAGSASASESYQRGLHRQNQVSLHSQDCKLAEESRLAACSSLMIDRMPFLASWASLSGSAPLASWARPSGLAGSASASESYESYQHGLHRQNRANPHSRGSVCKLAEESRCIPSEEPPFKMGPLLRLRSRVLSDQHGPGLSVSQTYVPRDPGLCGQKLLLLLFCGCSRHLKKKKSLFGMPFGFDPPAS